ncbi:MAG: hypothetical protein FWF70_07215 [Bacteroidetes bacterium]|nr:hypothetical protein [Bacteroidota bacterium]MCL1968884.1 hypothetical protein [Bacteroidota bacterium]MCL1968999.1 hypothetical protein [Bacteroidota bacterium]
MKQHHFSEVVLAEKLNLTKWAIRKLFQQKSIRINRLIEISYILGVNFLHVYLQKMPLFENSEYYEDDVIIKIVDNQVFINPAKGSRNPDFLKSIHIGKILKTETLKQHISEENLAPVICCTQSAISRIFHNHDIDIERLIKISYKLNYDFIRNVYLPYMSVNGNIMTSNDCIFDNCIIKINPKTISIINEKQTGIYHGDWEKKKRI